MTLCHFPLASKQISSQFHTCMDIGWILLISEEMFIICCKAWFFHPYHVSLQLFQFVFWLSFVWHACENHNSIPFCFIIYVVVHWIYIPKHQSGQPGINFMFPIVSEAWHLYHTFHRCYYFLMVLDHLRLPV